jgi:hypothetical protein
MYSTEVQIKIPVNSYDVVSGKSIESSTSITIPKAIVMPVKMSNVLDGIKTGDYIKGTRTIIIDYNDCLDYTPSNGHQCTLVNTEYEVIGYEVVEKEYVMLIIARRSD